MNKPAFRLASLSGAVMALGAHAAEPAASGMPGPPGSVIQVLFGLLLVVALMMAAAWLMKRFGGARLGTTAAVKIIGGTSVGGRERVMVVEVGDAWIVVGVAPGRVNSLATLPRQETPANTTTIPSGTFPDWLKQTIAKRKNG